MELTESRLDGLSEMAVKILAYLMIARGPRSQSYLKVHCRCSASTIEDAVRLLADGGWIVSTGRYIWALADGIQQLPLGTEALPEESHHENAIDGQAVESPDTISSQILRANPLASSSLTHLDSSKGNLLPLEGSSSQIMRAAVLAELDGQQIHEPARSRLARLAHVTPELIRYHAENCKNRGQAIYRIENNWKAGTVSAETFFQPVEHTFEAALEEDPVDDQAETWWSAITNRLRDHIPIADFYNFIPIDAPARHHGAVLSVRVCNLFGVEILKRYVGPEEVDRMVNEISAGAVRSVRFVTQWDG